MKTLILAMTFGLLIVVGTLSARAEHGGCVVRHLSDLGCECDAAAQCRKVCKLVKKEKESKKLDVLPQQNAVSFPQKIFLCNLFVF